MIQVRSELTPNPQTMRFSVIGAALGDGSFEFKSAQETLSSPLAKKLFGFPWTAGVLIGRDFLTVTKQDWVDWETLAEPLVGLIQEHLERGEPVMIAQTKSAPASASSPTTPEGLIRKILDEEIRPAVAMDGGDIVFSKYEDGVVYVHMQGSCAGCPSSTATLKQGIEVRLKQALPEIREVVSI